MMAPQSISFIADEDENENDIDEADNYIRPMPRRNGTSSVKKSFDQIGEFETSLGKLNITSGSRTYRIPSPTTRQTVAESSFQSMESQNESDQKGFYISFDSETPKRPKPPLRTKKSPKKSSEDLNESQPMSPQEEFVVQRKSFGQMQGINHHYQQPSNDSFKKNIEQPKYERHEPQSPRISSTPKESQAIVIGDAVRLNKMF
jgi:calmodulin-regulated spectrin-associated protein